MTYGPAEPLATPKEKCEARGLLLADTGAVALRRTTGLAEEAPWRPFCGSGGLCAMELEKVGAAEERDGPAANTKRPELRFTEVVGCFSSLPERLKVLEERLG